MTQPQDGGPAFPSEQGHTPDGTWNQTYESGMSQRALAAITLRVPDSGIEWLDAMILQAKRDEFAGQALGQSIQNVTSEYRDWSYQDAARCAYDQADAMIAERSKP